MRQQAPSLPAVSEAVEYYDIRGASEKELRCQMTENGCRWRDGKKYDSVTKWHVKWDYDHEQGPGFCSARTFRATVDIVYRYPQWIDSDRAAAPLQERWSEYMQSLTRHEQGHRDIAVKEVTDFLHAAEQLPAAATCEEIDLSIKKLSRTFMARLNEEQRCYDTDTEHGVKQGARFP